MPTYFCSKCNFSTTLKGNYERHLKTNKHLAKETKETKETKFSCQYCEKSFKHRQGLFKHVKFVCKKNKDEDLKELVRLMNIQDEGKKVEKKKNKQINQLMCKLQINGGFHQTNIQNNIQLLPYNNTDLSHLTEEDYINSIRRVNFCVKELIQRVHFNPSKPENMNIYISNLKDKYLMVYDGGNWTLKYKKDELNNLYDDKEMMLEEWLTDGQHQYPELKEKFDRYLSNKEDDETLNKIKDEIRLMMYNNKNIMLENDQKNYILMN